MAPKSLLRGVAALGWGRNSDVVARSNHPDVCAFADLWQARRQGRSIPDRAEFGIEDLVPWFGHVIIMDVIDGGTDFRYRMIGTQITRFLNRDYTGGTVLESNYGGARDKVIDTFRRPIVKSGPVFRHGYVAWAVDKTWRTYQSVHCPVTAFGSAGAAMTIGVLYFGETPVTGPNGSRWEDEPKHL